MRKIILIAHNLRSCHNVGSLLRTADGLGVFRVYLTGYTPYPITKNDSRLPHISQKLNKQIQKTALGAETSVKWEQSEEIEPLLIKLKSNHFDIVALEQAQNSIAIDRWKPVEKIAIMVGRETEGLEKSILDQCDRIIEIPMFGKKESFNVAQATAMALFHARFTNYLMEN